MSALAEIATGAAIVIRNAHIRSFWSRYFEQELVTWAEFWSRFLPWVAPFCVDSLAYSDLVAEQDIRCAV